jgi:CHASE1-domain containing sensor protein
VHPAGTRPEYHPILHLEPLDERNAAAIGYDMFTEPVRREAMARARDRGEPAMSGRVTLVQEIDRTDQQAGFLVYLPLYRRGADLHDIDARRGALTGFAYAPFRADDLFRGIFASTSPREVELQLYDDSRERTSTVASAPALADTLALELAGRRWTMVVVPGAGFEPSTRDRLAILAALLGLLTSVAFFALRACDPCGRANPRPARPGAGAGPGGDLRAARSRPRLPAREPALPPPRTGGPDRPATS